MKKILGSEFQKLPIEERKKLYPHIIYEFGSVFMVPPFGDDIELRESVYLRVMISIRNLFDFFNFDAAGQYYPTDVFGWQFFDDEENQNSHRHSEESLDIKKEEIRKISIQIAHITKERISLCDTKKVWNIELRSNLKPVVLKFVYDLFTTRQVSNMSDELEEGFSRLWKYLKYNEQIVQPSTTSGSSNTAFQVLTCSRYGVENKEYFSITDFINRLKID